MSGYTSDQLKQFQQEMRQISDDPLSFECRKMAMVRLGYALCFDDTLSSKQTWQITSSLATQAFGKEPDESLREDMVKLVGSMMMSGRLQIQEEKVLILQMSHYLSSGREQSNAVQAQIQGYLDDIGRLGLKELYGDNTHSTHNEQVNVPLDSFSFAWGLTN